MRGRGGPMSSKNSKADLKQKAVHEFRQFVAISLYLAFFFCAVTTYRMLLLNDFHDAYFNYISGLINALVIAKVILMENTRTLAKSMNISHSFYRLLIRRFCLACL
jgi:hypothetical protein